jgi:TIM-barrel protein
MFRPRVALASLSGQADAAWARAGSPHAGLAVLGGIALDERSRAAAREMVADRDRTEFLPDDPLAFVDTQLSSLTDAPIRAGLNVRSATPGPIADVAGVCADHGAVCEVNAHCRQDELCAVGCGESLLRETDRLADYVARAADAGAVVGVKVRTEVPGVDLVAVCRAIEDAGAAYVHVDAMDSEAVVADVAAATDLFVVANNGVRDRETAWEYLDHGADAVSVGRPSDDPAVLACVRDAVDAWFQRRAEEEARP